MEEQELIRQAGQGDESAFEALVKAYEKPVYNLCLRMCGDRDEAFDLSQDTFIKAWHAIALFQGDSKFQTWLLRIASNTCIDHLRRKKRRKTVSLTELDDENQPLERQIADYSTDPALLAEKAQDHEAVRAAMDRDSLPAGRGGYELSGDRNGFGASSRHGKIPDLPGERKN